jgi:hypothetical protein
MSIAANDVTAIIHSLKILSRMLRDPSAFLPRREVMKHIFHLSSPAEQGMIIKIL